ncbi:MAG: hypothetical protein F6J93_32270 [Oscillatoria sp. SIO1A7]|nr:hypothetical protein [Oscillatoria sp. SIO1A7]
MSWDASPSIDIFDAIGAERVRRAIGGRHGFQGPAHSKAKVYLNSKNCLGNAIAPTIPTPPTLSIDIFDAIGGRHGFLGFLGTVGATASPRQPWLLAKISCHGMLRPQSIFLMRSVGGMGFWGEAFQGKSLSK